MSLVGDHAWDNCRHHGEAVGASSRLNIYAYRMGVHRETVMMTTDVNVIWAAYRLVAPYPPDHMLSRSSRYWHLQGDRFPFSCMCYHPRDSCDNSHVRSTPPLRHCLPPPSCNTGTAPQRHALRRRSRLPRRRARDCLARRQAGATRYPPPSDY